MVTLIAGAFLMFAFAVGSHGQTVDLSRFASQISSGSSEQKRSALSEIRNLRTEAASRLAVPALRDNDELVRATAAGSVIFLPKSEASAALIPVLNDKAEFVRREAAYALGESGDASAVAPLARLLQNDKILEVRTATAVALGKIGEPSAIESLAAVLKRRPIEDEEFLRRSAARSIGQIAQVQSTGNSRVLTPQNFLPEKFKDLDPGAATAAPNFASVVDLLIRVLNNDDESDDTRREAAYSLGAIADEKAAPALQRYASSADPYLGEICREALAKIAQRNAKASS